VPRIIRASGNDIHVENCDIVQSGGRGISSTVVGGVVTVLNSRVTDCNESGIIAPCGLVANTLVDDSGGIGISLVGSATTPSIFRGCVIKNTGAQGVRLGSAARLENSVISNCQGAGIEVGTGCSVIGNTISETSLAGGIDGALMITGDGCYIDGNHFLGGAAFASGNIYMNGDFCTIVRNVFTKDNFINADPMLTDFNIGPTNDLTNPWTNFFYNR